MAEDPKTQKRVLLPIYYPARNTFKAGGVDSGAFDAQARCTTTLESFPHWVMGLRIVNVYRLDNIGAIGYSQAADLATSRIDLLQEIRATIGTYQIFDWTAQENITGSKGHHWHPFPMRMGIRGNVNLVVEARRLTGYPDGIIPSLDITLVTVSARAGRPGDIWDIDVVA